MSIHVMALVWKNATVSGSELIVLLALADYADDAGRNIFPSMKSLADKARLSDDQARRVVQTLMDKGYVNLVAQGGWRDGRNWSNEYSLALNLVGGGVASAQVPPPAPTQGQSPHPRKDSPRADAPTVLAPVRDDPSLDPSYEPPCEDEGAPVRDKATEDWAIVVAAMERAGILLNGQMSEEYQDMLKDYGVDAVVRGIGNAADNGKALRVNYVRACVQNIAQGTAPPVKGQAEGKHGYNLDAYLDEQQQGPRKRYAVGA